MGGGEEERGEKGGERRKEERRVGERRKEERREGERRRNCGMILNKECTTDFIACA